MPFLSGRVTYSRFKVSGDHIGIFGLEHLAKLEDAAIGKRTVAMADGSQMGWVTGDHILDAAFDIEKNIVNDSLQFAIRIDEIKVPADLLRSYYLTELAALAAQNPSGHPSARQKREAKAVAKERLEQEAKDGRFVRRRMIPVMWDGIANELLVGTTSENVIDRVDTLFGKTFGRQLVRQVAGVVAEGFADDKAVADAVPTKFTHGGGDEVAWTSAMDDRNWLGNEFLLWLWHVVENVTDTIKLGDGSEVAVMLARTLTLECPRGQYGSESFRSDGPAKLPEAIRALQVGRLPRKVGLTMVRHVHCHELTIQAETLAVSAAKLSAPQEEDARARLEERVGKIRHLVETMDLLFAAFVAERLGGTWDATASKMRGWLGRREVAA